jgi:hypothetical protein
LVLERIKGVAAAKKYPVEVQRVRHEALVSEEGGGPAYCWIDHHALYTALRHARTATSPTTQAHHLRQAVALHTVPLLEDVDLRRELARTGPDVFGSGS